MTLPEPKASVVTSWSLNIDAGQASHFFGVFQIAKIAKWIPKDCQVEHVPFGLVQGENGKKLKNLILVGLSVAFGPRMLTCHLSLDRQLQLKSNTVFLSDINVIGTEAEIWRP